MEEVFLDKQMKQAKLEEEEEQQEAIEALRGVKQNIRATRTMTQRDLLAHVNGANSPNTKTKKSKKTTGNGEKVAVVDESTI
jgi:DNA-binding protein H-NS